MADVTVFVDDAVTGALPAVCAKDGTATGDRMRVRSDVGGTAGLGVAWLLLLAGPLGWLGLLVISGSKGSSGDVLTVDLPISEPAYQRVRAARALRGRACLAGMLGGASVLAAAMVGDGWMLMPIAAAVVVIAIVVLFVAESRINRSLVGVELDASRRWVTLSKVHPAFVAACAAQLQQRQRT